MAWKVLVFRQGLGWESLSTIFPHSGVVHNFQDAVTLGATVVIRELNKAVKPHGSSFGDVVGFRIISSNENSQPLPHDTVNWEDVRHRFFKRGDSYILYKSWSWPD
ncbi:MAG: hypothetical protein QXF45_03545 [Candidatus Caldarchaeum sp.]